MMTKHWENLTSWLQKCVNRLFYEFNPDDSSEYRFKIDWKDWYYSDYLECLACSQDKLNEYFWSNSHLFPIKRWSYFGWYDPSKSSASWHTFYIKSQSSHLPYKKLLISFVKTFMNKFLALARLLTLLDYIFGWKTTSCFGFWLSTWNHSVF